MIFFFDTSALIKRYIVENGSEKVDNLFKTASQIIISPVTKIETCSTINRLKVENAISKEDYSSPSSITKCNTEENRVSFVYEKNI